MPIGVIAAGVTAAATIGGAALSSSATKKAAKSATNTALTTSAADNALQRETRDMNVSLAQPWMQSGLQANSAINALLGLGGAPAASAAPQTPATAPQSYPAYTGAGTPVNALGGAYVDTEGFSGPMNSPAGRRFNNVDALQYTGGDPMTTTGQFGPAEPYPAAAPASNVAPGTTPYANAFQNFLNSTGFQFQMDQGNKAVNQGYAARGTLQSGAALKALQDRGQQTALSNYFLPYMNLLGQQQGVGLSATNATMGVGTNYANQVSGNNQAAASVAMNAAGVAGSANSQMYGSIAGALGNVAGSFGSSYRPPVPQTPDYSWARM
jgi:hypothetical protein